MNKTDYNKVMEEKIKNFTFKPKLLLHVCCAPCFSGVFEKLVDFFDITLLFYNPNMDTKEEFDKRNNELLMFVEGINQKIVSKINIITIEYNHNEFLNKVFGKENEKEGGSRCYNCFYLRLLKTCEIAKENGYDFFTTTLSVSPYKNSEMLNQIGKELQEKYNINYLFSDFKKKEGYKRSIELSREFNLYRQNYCGCEFSKNQRLFEKTIVDKK